MNCTSIPLIQWSILKCFTKTNNEYRVIGWYKRSYISSALVSFDSSARIFMCNNSYYFIPIGNQGTNFTALFNFNCWASKQEFNSIKDVSFDFC